MSDQGKKDAATRAVEKLVNQGLLDEFQKYNIAQVIRQEYESAAPSPAPETAGLTTKEHHWNRDGETCLDCGQKDWMRGSVCTPASPPAAQEQKPVACQHEAYQGTCAHCGVSLVGGYPVYGPAPVASPIPALGWVMVPRELTKPMHEVMETAGLGHAESDWVWKQILAAVAVGETK